MRVRFPSSAVILLLATSVATLLDGCGNFWKAPGSTGSSTGTATTTTLTPSASTATVGDSVTLTATVSPSAATGTVTFYANSASIGTQTLTSGTATLDTTFSAAGTESLTATYGGSDTYASSTSSAVTVTVSAASATARIAQPITASSIHTTAYGAAPLHAVGAFQSHGGSFSAQNAEATVVEGGGSVTLAGVTLNSAAGAGRAIRFANTSPTADAQAQAHFVMNGGSITYNCAAAGSDGCASKQTEPAIFSVANAKAAISLTDTAVIAPTAANGQAGTALLTAGQQGAMGTVSFTARGTSLAGDVNVGATAEATLELLKDDAGKGSSLTGAINPQNAARSASLALDATSRWTVTANSHLSALSGLDVSNGTITNIDGSGHCVYYSGSVNGASGSAVYALSGGGYLAPEGTAGLACQ